MSKEIIEIDGSLGEGGGQILRTSLALSLITGQPFHLKNIRAGRAKPGLHAQHLMCVKAAVAIGKAQQRGASLASTDLVFDPGEVTPGEYHFRIGTAGANSLVLHTIYLPLAMACQNSLVTIEGGTHVKASPSTHFIQITWASYLRAMGLVVDITLARPGFYPRGGGKIEARIEPVRTLRAFQGISAERITKARIHSALAGLPAHVGERQVGRAAQRLEEFDLEVEIHQETWPGGPGCMLGVELATQPAPTFFFGLGDKGKPAEMVADEAIDQVAAYLRSQPIGVDAHSADQLVLPLALAEASSRFRTATLSLHLLTNIQVINLFIDREIRCECSDGDTGIVIIT